MNGIIRLCGAIGALVLSGVTSTTAAALPRIDSVLSPYIVRSGGVTAQAVPPQFAALQGFLDVATYRIRTRFIHPDGGLIERDVPALVVLGPLILPVDVDGDNLPDIATEIIPVATDAVTVSFFRTPLAFGRALPVAAEVIVDLPGGTNGATLGFDAMAGNMPNIVTTEINFDRARLAAGDVKLGITGRVSNPQATPTMAYLGSFFQRGAANARINPITARADLTPLPSSLSVALDISNGLNPVIAADLGSSEPARAQVQFNTVNETISREVRATVDSLPSSARLVFAQENSITLGNLSGKLQRVQYTAAQAITRVDATLLERTTEFNQITRNVVAVMEDVPTEINVAIDGPLTEVTANAPIGVIEAGLSNFELSPLLTGVVEPAYAFSETNRIDPVLVRKRSAVRIPGLTHALVDTGDGESGRPLVLDLDFAGGALRAKLTELTRVIQPNTLVFSVDALIDAVPSDVHIEFGAEEGRFSYIGGAPINLMTASVFKIGGLTGPRPGSVTPTNLTLKVEDIPGTIDVNFAVGEQPPNDDPSDLDLPERMLVDFRAGELDDQGRVVGPGIGRVEALLTSGGLPADALPVECPKFGPCAGGLVFEEVPGKFALQARVDGLKQVALFTGGKDLDFPFNTIAEPRVRARVDSVATDPFSIRVKRLEDGAPRFLRADFSNLAPGIDLRLRKLVIHVAQCGVFVICAPENDPDGNGFADRNIGAQLFYSADQTIDQLTLTTDFGGRAVPLFARIEDVPANLDLCFSTEEACTTVFGRQFMKGLTMRLDASSPFTVDALLCDEPANASCTFQNPQAMTKGLFLSKVGLEDLRLELDLKQSEGDPNRIQFNTRNKPISGLLLFRSEGAVVNAVLDPALVPANAVFDSAVTIDIIRDGVDLDIDLLNLPGAALNTTLQGLQLTQTGAQVGGNRGLACDGNTSVQAGVNGVALSLRNIVCQP